MVNRSDTGRRFAAALITLLALCCPLARASAQSLPPTFSQDIAPILFDKCVACHREGGAGPFSLTSYSEVRRHATQIAFVTSRRLMPPWKSNPRGPAFVDQTHLSDLEIERIDRWLKSGAAEGDPRSLPPLPASASEGWQLGTPDLVIQFPGPYLLRASGADAFRIFSLPVPIAATRFVRGLEFKPGNGRVVHHANILVDMTGASGELDARDPLPGYDGLTPRSAEYPDGHFLGWTPGQVAPLLPAELAWQLKPGASLVVKLHLQPSGKAEAVQPSIALFFSDAPPSRTPAMLRLSRQDIDIPAGSTAHVVTDSFRLPVDVQVQAVQPHAHYRARQIQGVARLPNGSTRELISIADWDFRWQHVYRYVVPFWLPRGTTVEMRVTYDNSPANPRSGTGPPVRVRWGQQSTDEMGDLWLQVLTRDERDRAILRREFGHKIIHEDIKGYERLVEIDPADSALRNDLAMLYLDAALPLEAARHFEAVVDVQPSPTAHFNLGLALTLGGLLARAEREYQLALAMDPAHSGAHNNLGDLLLRKGDIAMALRHFREAGRLEPANAEAHFNMARALERRGDWEGAIAALRAAMALRPESASIVAGLGWLLATAPGVAEDGRAEAVVIARRAVALTSSIGGDSGALDVLAVALASVGRFDEARRTAAQALAMAPDDSRAAAIRAHLEAFDRQEPVHMRSMIPR